jgi:hypothetical protein
VAHPVESVKSILHQLVSLAAQKCSNPEDMNNETHFALARFSGHSFSRIGSRAISDLLTRCDFPRTIYAKTPG